MVLWNNEKLHDLVGFGYFEEGGVGVGVDFWKCGVVVEVCAPELLHQYRWKYEGSRIELI